MDSAARRLRRISMAMVSDDLPAMASGVETSRVKGHSSQPVSSRSCIVAAAVMLRYVGLKRVNSSRCTSLVRRMPPNISWQLVEVQSRFVLQTPAPPPAPPRRRCRRLPDSGA
eukprot:scaffold60418_cov56-Phaeocystis_antarctica.AAC.5